MSDTKRPTIRDVARLAGVSTASVSQAMNDRGRMRQETRDRIFVAAEQLGWRPSSTARAVNGVKPHAIGMIVRRETRVLDGDSFFTGLIAGIEHVAASNGLAVTLRFVDNERDEDAAYRTLWRERNVSGFLVTDPRVGERRLELLEELEATAVVIGDLGPDRRFPTCFHDSTQALTEAVRALRGHGHERVAYVSGPPEFVHSHRRREQFEALCAAQGAVAEAAGSGDFTLAGGAQAVARLLARRALPTALVFASDAMALGALAELTRRGVRVPDEVSLVGFDGVAMGRFVVPTLSTVACDYVRLGTECTTMLLDPTDAVAQTVLEARWVAGESLGPARHSD